MPALSSSNLAACDYDEAAREMSVTFNSGAVYVYSGVPREVYDGLVASPTPGSYFWRHVRGSYTHRQE